MLRLSNGVNFKVKVKAEVEVENSVMKSDY